MKHSNSYLLNSQRGQLLLEILIVIGVAAVIIGLGSQFIYLSLRSSKVSAEKNVALGLLEETFEAVRSTSTEKWQNLYNLTHATADYHPDSISIPGKWVLLANTQEVTINGVPYTRSFRVRHVCRQTTSTRNITGITDTDGSSQTCVASGGADDPSTQKVTVTISWPNTDPVIGNEYFAGRWRNKVCNQTDWTGGAGGSLNTTCKDTPPVPPTTYDTKDATIDTSAGSLKLQ